MPENAENKPGVFIAIIFIATAVCLIYFSETTTNKAFGLTLTSVYIILIGIVCLLGSIIPQKCFLFRLIPKLLGFPFFKLFGDGSYALVAVIFFLVGSIALVFGIIALLTGWNF